MKKRLFYSIEIDCENNDVKNFIESYRPTDFKFEFSENVIEEMSVFESLAESTKPENMKEIDKEARNLCDNFRKENNLHPLFGNIFRSLKLIDKSK